MGSEPGLFDVDDRLRRLSDLGDQLVAFGRVVDFEIFRSDLDAALGYRSGPQGGRPPFDCGIRAKADTDSDGSRTVIPIDPGQL